MNVPSYEYKKMVINQTEVQQMTYYYYFFFVLLYFYYYIDCDFLCVYAFISR